MQTINLWLLWFDILCSTFVHRFHSCSWDSKTFLQIFHLLFFFSFKNLYLTFVNISFIFIMYSRSWHLVMSLFIINKHYCSIIYNSFYTFSSFFLLSLSLALFAVTLFAFLFILKDEISLFLRLCVYCIVLYDSEIYIIFTHI